LLWFVFPAIRGKPSVRFAPTCLLGQALPHAIQTHPPLLTSPRQLHLTILHDLCAMHCGYVVDTRTDQSKTECSPVGHA
jgi:hypothetical protein